MIGLHRHALPVNQQRTRDSFHGIFDDANRANLVQLIWINDHLGKLVTGKKVVADINLFDAVETDLAARVREYFSTGSPGCPR